MADAQQLRRLIAYNQWADERVLAAIEGLSPDELERPREAYFGTIAGNLRHTVMAQARWLARWKGEALPPVDQPLGPWRQAFAASHSALARYVATLSDDDVDRVVKYTLATGVAREQPLGQLVTHLVNHGTHHRAETGLLLERIGRSPGDLDYIVFLHGQS
jgi:uncharacterized damage-inducible protein DinB